MSIVLLHNDNTEKQAKKACAHLNKIIGANSPMNSIDEEFSSGVRLVFLEWVVSNNGLPFSANTKKLAIAGKNVEDLIRLRKPEVSTARLGEYEDDARIAVIVVVINGAPCVRLHPGMQSFEAWGNHYGFVLLKRLYNAIAYLNS